MVDVLENRISSEIFPRENGKFYFSASGQVMTVEERDALVKFRRGNGQLLLVYFAIERIVEIGAVIGSKIEHEAIEDGSNYESRLRLVI
jgi:hypothetical protein